MSASYLLTTRCCLHTRGLIYLTTLDRTDYTSHVTITATPLVESEGHGALRSGPLAKLALFQPPQNKAAAQARLHPASAKVDLTTEMLPNQLARVAADTLHRGWLVCSSELPTATNPPRTV